MGYSPPVRHDWRRAAGLLNLRVTDAMTEYDLTMLSDAELRHLECILMKALRSPLRRRP